MIATLRRLLLITAGAALLSTSGFAQVSADLLAKTMSAAEQGDAKAQYNLGSMYDTGQGVAQNNVEAYKWLSLAAAQGDSSAAKNRDTVRGKITPTQVAEGQRLAAAWKPKGSDN